MEQFENPLADDHKQDAVYIAPLKKRLPIQTMLFGVVAIMALTSFAMAIALFSKVKRLDDTTSSLILELQEQGQRTAPKFQIINETKGNPVSLLLQLQNQIQKLNKSTSQLVDSNKVELCSVGIKDGRVSDEDMTASSSWSDKHLARYGRLDRPGGTYSFWHAKHAAVGEWIQVYLHTATRVTGVITQGRSDNIQDFVKTYKIAYGNSTGILNVMQYSNGTEIIFQGNKDMHTHVTNMFPTPVVAKYLRLIAMTWNRVICVRLEYLTC